jgi:hypothetical protein
MKQYVIDELRPADYDKLNAYLNDTYGPACLGGIYWVPLDPGRLTDVQKQHAECQPFYVAIELDRNHLACELLVRTKNRVRCGCIEYATGNQRTYLIEMIDHIFNHLEIKT